MDKFCHITDIHFRNTQPPVRKDDYNESLLEKIKYVLEFCKRHNVKNLLITGDLADSHNISAEVMLKFIKLLKQFKIHVYFIYGNHDFNANVLDTGRTVFGLVEELPWFHCVSTLPAEFKHTVVGGYDFKKDQACDNTWIFPVRDVSKVTILLTHPMIVNEKTMIIGTQCKQRNVKEVTTTADVMLCGHYHLGFPKVVETSELDKVSYIVNPGSIARRSITDATDGYGPRFTYITVTSSRKINIKLYKIPCKSVRESFYIDERIKKKVENYNKDQFIESLNQIKSSGFGGKGFTETFKILLKNPPKSLRKIAKPEVLEYALEKLEEVQR